MNRTKNIRRLAAMATVGIASLALATAAFAWSGDTALTAASACANPATGMATVTYTVHLTSLALGYGGRTVVTQSSQPGLVPVGSSLHNGQQFTESVPAGTLPQTLTIKVNYPDRGGDLTQYPASATAYGVTGCQPVIHTPSIRGAATCNSKTGQYTVTYTAADLQGGTATPALPIVHTLPGTAKSDSASTVVAYTNGPSQTASATVPLSGTCRKPPPPCTIKNGCRAFYAPSASLVGPCGDPFYRATFNNSKSNRPVKFVYRYHAFGGGWRHITVTVKAHHVHRTRYVHVLGRSNMSVYAGHRGLVAFRVAAAPGDYKACQG